MTDTVEEVESFRQRARDWLADNLPRIEHSRAGRGDPYGGTLTDNERVARARWVQRTLFDGGFAGLVFPKEYGGQGLTAAHQRAFAEESAGYESPLWMNTSTLAIMAPILLEFGTEQQRARHIPAILRGDEFWAQLLSEPSGGSDLAGALTRADRDGDGWRLNGSKVWSSGAHLRDFGMCLARTDWDVPKHEGLSIFIVDLRALGVTVTPIVEVNGSTEFCQEYFEDVVLPEDALVGQLNQGWSVATRMLMHERAAVGGGSPYAGGARGGGKGRGGTTEGPAKGLSSLARPGVSLAAIGEAHVIATVRGQLSRRVSEGIRRGELPSAGASLAKLMTSATAARLATIGADVAGSHGVAALPGERAAVYSTQFLSRQANSIAGGTSEMQRNMISERLLGMPKETALDRGIPFREVRRNSSSNSPKH